MTPCMPGKHYSDSTASPATINFKVVIGGRAALAGRGSALYVPSSKKLVQACEIDRKKKKIQNKQKNQCPPQDIQMKLYLLNLTPATASNRNEELGRGCVRYKPCWPLLYPQENRTAQHQSQQSQAANGTFSADNHSFI